MKFLLAQTTAIQKIINRQKVKSDIKYRESRFLVHVPCKDGELLYNTLTGALVLLETGETQGENRERLIEERFWIPDGFDEQAYCDSLRKICWLVNAGQKNKKSFTILTTTDCNARCYYCYEMGIRRFSMSEETAQNVAKYIARVSGGEKISLNWFGGEPLYNRNVIDIICCILKERRIPYTSTMVSNGFFMDAETAAIAYRDWRLTRVHITLDGTEQVYNRTKAYVHYDGNAYRRVLDNIETAADAGIEVSIRLNMDGRNVEDLFSLVDELASRFRGRKGIYTYVQLLQEVTGKIGTFPSEQLAAQRCIELTDKLVEQGITALPMLNRDLIINRCMADNDTCEVVAPDGKILKCEHYNEAELVGSIYSDERDRELIDSWKERVVFPECRDCAMYPRCRILKKCDWSKKGCPESLRIIKQDRLQKQILAVYRRSKK